MADEGGPLRAARQRAGLTLAEVAAATGVGASTLSRIESGRRRASLDVLLPLADLYRVSLDDLVGRRPTADPRIRPRPIRRDGITLVPLTRLTEGMQAHKILIPADAERAVSPRTHDGYEQLYVLTGRLRLVLGEHDLELGPGEAAEFDTRVPHWFGAVAGGSVELLSLFGEDGRRVHVRASTSPPAS